MSRLVHLLDDFGMGGVTRALTLFDEPELNTAASSRIVAIDPVARLAPTLHAELIIDHMALSWRRLAFLASLRAKHPRSRIVHVEHSYTRSFEQWNVKAKRRFRTMLRMSSLFFDEIICVSEAQRGWIANEVGITSSKLHVIHPWTNQHQLFQVPPKSPNRGQPMRLLAYGRYASVKNFSELISAIRNMPRGMVSLTLFGDGPERDALRTLAADLPNVSVLGPCDDPGAHLRSCDAVVIPSRYEAFGLVATEARMAARAILVADVDGLPEQVGKGGLSAPLKTADEISSAIFRLAKLNLRSLGEAGRREVRKQMPNTVAQWRAVIGRANHRGQASPRILRPAAH